MDLSQRKVQQQIIEKPSQDTLAGSNPTQIRYGWVPFKDIWLLGPDGAPNPFVQPYEIAGPDGKPIRNPMFEKLPKGQLIAFPTFDIIEQAPSQDVRLPDGRAAVESTVRPRTSLECVVLVARVWGRQGFTILQALQGLDQSLAQRIFAVVQPFDYPIGQIQSELEFADDRINATAPIVFKLADGDYTIDNLVSDEERDIARRLRDQMLVGAEIAYTLATEELDATQMSMINKHAGGKGKDGPDKHDRYLCEELGRKLPEVVTSKEIDLSGLEKKLDYVVDREKDREKDEEIARLKAQIEALRTPPVDEPFYCAGIKADQTPCRSVVKAAGEYCVSHKSQEVAHAA
jgi:hypothetical protein